MEEVAFLQLLPALKAFGTIFGTYGLWRLASRVKTSTGPARAAAWAWFWCGAALAMALFSIVACYGESSPGPVALSSLAVHAPWIAFLSLRIRAPRFADDDGWGDDGWRE